MESNGRPGPPMDDYGHDISNYSGKGWQASTLHHATVNGEPSLVVHCPLKEGLDGDAMPDSIQTVIRIDESLRGREYLETLIHEFLHCALPSGSEEWVTMAGHELSQLIFEADCRRRAGLS